MSVEGSLKAFYLNKRFTMFDLSTSSMLYIIFIISFPLIYKIPVLIIYSFLMFLVRKYYIPTLNLVEKEIDKKGIVVKPLNFILAYDRKVKRRVLHKVKNGYAHSLVTDYKFKYIPKSERKLVKQVKPNPRTLKYDVVKKPVTISFKKADGSRVSFKAKKTVYKLKKGKKK